jgi:hypothetical protein
VSVDFDKRGRRVVFDGPTNSKHIFKLAVENNTDTDVQLFKGLSLFDRGNVGRDISLFCRQFDLVNAAKQRTPIYKTTKCLNLKEFKYATHLTG